MRDAIDRVLAYAEPGRETFMAEPMRQDAIVRNLETAGEAAKQVWDVVAKELPKTREHLLVLIESVP